MPDEKVFQQPQTGWLRLPPIHVTVTGPITVHAGDPCFQEKVLDHLTGLKTQGAHIMSQISDFAGRVQANVDKISTDIAAVAQLVQTLQTSAGTITPEDQATLDALEAKVATLTGAADNLVPPVPGTPATPPTA